MQRIHVLFGCLILFYIGITARLFYWQIIKGNTLQVSAASQHDIQSKIPAKRGEIVTNDGAILVTNQPSYFMYAEPQQIEQKDVFARLIAPLIGKESQELFTQITDPEKKWIPLKRDTTVELKEAVEKLNVQGIGFQPRSMRFYPEASMAAHVLGFVGQDNQGNDMGYFGIEGYYNRELAGKDGSVAMQKDARGGQILIGDAMRVEPENGRTLVLWLNRSIQHIVETRLKEGMKKYGAKEGTVIVMDPNTGGIIAMSSYPNYDPSQYQLFDKEFYKNPAVAKNYEPGSTFKPLMMAAGINENVLSSTTTFTESGPIQIGEYSIKTWNDEYHGTMNMVDVLKYSSNVGMVFVSRQLGNKKILSYVDSYGFGQKTNIDLEDEASPLLRERNSWTEIDYATVSFGQGIAVTPLQLVRAVGAVANNGWLMEPRLVKEFRDSHGKIVPLKEKKIKQVMSEKTAREVTQMMVSSAKYGEAKWAAPKGYKVAGKTGTAQIPVSGHYDEDKTIASFVGFAPADDPKFVMLVVLTEPQSSQWGSETAAPLFFVIAKDIFQYYGIAPTEE